uniref:Putative LRR receptor-like serine/threonine-protein kinase n=1 Tax=Aegilops tauschii TaxID=37682 RepID=N1QVW2_AEGTA
MAEFEVAQAVEMAEQTTILEFIQDVAYVKSNQRFILQQQAEIDTLFDKVKAEMEAEAATNQSGALQAHAQLESNGFISIDCGLPGQTGYVDKTTTLSYTTDAGFIDTDAGVNHNISAEYITPSTPTSLHSVRSFPSGERNCYTLGSLVSGLKYLLRGKFLYANYDGLNMLPMFDLYIGVNFWTTVNISASDVEVYAEAIMVAPDDFVQVCLINTGGGMPFISGLDLRPLKNKLYPLANETQALVLLHRFNFGPTDSHTIIRYPDDPHDRIWFPFVDVENWVDITAGEKVNILDELFQPPQEVMQTAITPRDVSENIEFTLDLESFPRDHSLGYVHTVYFCELQEYPSSNALRQFYIYRNGVLTYLQVYTPPYLAGDFVNSLKPFQASQYKISLNATAKSTLPPIINAIELFSVTSPPPVGTNSQDVFAIRAVKKMYQVQKNWMGDPCLPETLSWDNLTCSYNSSRPPIIRIVNMSFNDLQGGISPDFAALKNLQSMDLSNNNLTGSIPEALSQLESLKFLYDNNPDICTNGSSCQPERGSNLAIYIVVPVVVIVVLLLVAMLYFCLQRKRKQGSIKNSVKLKNDGDGNSSLGLESHRFTYRELETITNNFQRVLGRGGFGCVFHGSLEDGTQVAVKLRSHSSNQGVRQFLAEAQVLSRIHHKNLVSMIGYCKDGEQMALVYEYMPEGTLQEHIAGLEYLHKGCNPPLIHMDVKTANILLNERLEAKIADFGLSKAFNCHDDTHISTNTIAGTHGYKDPEYSRTGQASTKSDVYSFGVVLLELVTGKPAILPDTEPISIINWARQRLARGDIEGVVDTRMQGDHDINAVWKATEIALKCTEQVPLQRPSMAEVVMQIQECLDLEEVCTGRDDEFYTGSSSVGMDPNMGYNASTNRCTDLRQNNATLEIEYNHRRGPQMDTSPVATR